jgi:hypothetical protein
MAVATCHTDGCTNAEVPIEITTSWTDEFGEEHPVHGVTCGVCGQSITDVIEV